MAFKGIGFDAVEGTTTAAPGGSALTILMSTLAGFGLPETLADWAWSEIVAGKSEAEILLDLRQRPEFKAEYGDVIDGRAKAGLAPMSVQEIQNYRQTARELFHAAGLPEEFYDTKAELDAFMVKNKSLAELNDNIAMAKQAAYSTTPDVLQVLQRDYGVDAGGLTAWFLDPAVAEPLLEKRFNAAKIGGAAQRAGFGVTTREQNEQLADLGVSAEQAQQGFSQLGGQRELFGALPGEAGADTIDRQAQIDATFAGNARERRRIARQQQRRLAVFEGGGGAAATSSGVVGLSSATR